MLLACHLLLLHPYSWLYAHTSEMEPMFQALPRYGQNVLRYSDLERSHQRPSYQISRELSLLVSAVSSGLRSEVGLVIVVSINKNRERNIFVLKGVKEKWTLV